MSDNKTINSQSIKINKQELEPLLLFQKNSGQEFKQVYSQLISFIHQLCNIIQQIFQKFLVIEKFNSFLDYYANQCTKQTYNIAQRHKNNQSINFLFTFLIALLSNLQKSTEQQMNIQYVASDNICLNSYQVSFHPTNPDLFAVACNNQNIDQIFLYNISNNVLQMIQYYNSTLQQWSLQGLQYSPRNGSRALAVFYTINIQIFSITQDQIFSEYSLFENKNTQYIDISPSGNYAVVSADQYILLYKIYINYIERIQCVDYTQTNQEFYGASFANETIFLAIDLYYRNIYQFILQNESIIQLLVLNKNNNYFEDRIIFMKGSNTSGLMTSSWQNRYLYFFNYTYNGSSYYFNFVEQYYEYLDFGGLSYWLSASFSADNQRLVQTFGYDNLSIFSTNLANYCIYQNESKTCQSCLPGYSPPSIYCPTHCNQICNSKFNQGNCDTSIYYTPAVISYQSCTCPNGTFDDGFSLQCQPCSYFQCKTCQNALSCEICIGSNGLLSSRLLPNCTCPTYFYFDAYPDFLECQDCPPQCMSCFNITSCIVCIGNATGNLTRLPPFCQCMPGFYSNLLLSDNCLACPISCAACLNSSFCTQCVGSQNTSNSRIASKLCACPNLYYDALPQLQDCQPCSFNTCLTCTNSSQCEQCIGPQSINSSRLLPNCTCPINYYSNLSISFDCLACPITCTTCLNSSFCTSCPNQLTNGRLILQNLQQCSCSNLITEYYNISNYIYIINTDCTSICCTALCNSGFYFDYNQQTCSPCSSMCLTCNQSSSLCTSCNATNNLILAGSQCVCQIGFTLNIDNPYSCSVIYSTQSLPSNIPLINTFNDAEDNFPIVNITFKVPLQQQLYSDKMLQNLQITIGNLQTPQNYIYNITARSVNYFVVKVFFLQSIGQVKIIVSFPNTLLADIYNRPIPLSSINYQYGPYLEINSESEKKLIQNVQSIAETAIENPLVNFLRSISFVAYFLASVQFTFSFLLIDAVYPQNFYEVLRLICSSYVSTIPPWNQLQQFYSYSILIFPITLKLQSNLQSIQLYRLGFAGYFLIDCSRQLFSIIFAWIFMLFVTRKIYNKYKLKYTQKQMKYIALAFLLSKQTLIKMHETIFGILFYSILIELSCLTFVNSISIASFLFLLLAISYFLFVGNFACRKINSTTDTITLEIYQPLLIRLNINGGSDKLQYLRKNFALISYLKKALFMMCVYFGQGFPNFQLGSLTAIQILNIAFIVYLKPYSNHLYTAIKLLGESSLLSVLIQLLVLTNKMQQIMASEMASNDQVQYVNQLGWIAAWTLCVFNGLYLIMLVIDYVFDFIDCFRKQVVQNQENQNNIEGQNDDIRKQDKISYRLVEIGSINNKPQNQLIQHQNNFEQQKSNNDSGLFKLDLKNTVPILNNIQKINDIQTITNNRYNFKNKKQNSYPRFLNFFKYDNSKIKYKKCMSIKEYLNFDWKGHYLQSAICDYQNDFDNVSALKNKFESQIELLRNQIIAQEKNKDKINTKRFKYITQIQLQQFINIKTNVIQQAQPEEILRQVEQYLQDNENIAQFLYQQQEIDFVHLIQEYNSHLLHHTRTIMINIESIIAKSSESLQIQWQNQKQTNKLLKIAWHYLFHLNVLLLLLYILQKDFVSDSEIFNEFETLDIFYQEYRFNPYILLRRTQNEILHLSRKYPLFYQILIKKSQNMVRRLVVRQKDYLKHTGFDRQQILEEVVETLIQYVDGFKTSLTTRNIQNLQEIAKKPKQSYHEAAVRMRNLLIKINFL